MDFKLERIFKASVIFEASIAVNEHSFLLIYGEDINGYWCCIPNWDVGGKMSSPDHIHYNQQQLEIYGIEPADARGVAQAIAQVAKDHQPQQTAMDKLLEALGHSGVEPDEGDELDGPD